MLDLRQSIQHRNFQHGSNRSLSHDEHRLKSKTLIRTARSTDFVLIISQWLGRQSVVRRCQSAVVLAAPVSCQSDCRPVWPSGCYEVTEQVRAVCHRRPTTDPGPPPDAWPGTRAPRQAISSADPARRRRCRRRPSHPRKPVGRPAVSQSAGGRRPCSVEGPSRPVAGPLPSSRYPAADADGRWVSTAPLSTG